MSKRISWTYSHSLGRSRVRLTKIGTFYGRVKHTVRHWRNPEAVQMAVVHFDHQRRSSRVPYDELTFLDDSE